MAQAFFVKVEIDLGETCQGIKQGMRNNIVRKAFRGTCALMRTDLRAHLPSDTGAEIRSIGSNVSIKYDKVTGTAGPKSKYKYKDKEPARYAPAVEGGRKEAKIKRKKVLSDGNQFFGTQVKAVGGKHTFQNLQASRGTAYALDLSDRIFKGIEEATRKLAVKK